MLGGRARDQVISYRNLRRFVGPLGMALPIVLMFLGLLIGGKGNTEPSVGAGYRDLFVGVLSAIAVLFFAYRGPRRKDDIAGDLAALFALGVAFPPTNHPTSTVRTRHAVCAVGLLTVLSHFALVLFPWKRPLQRDGAGLDTGSAGRSW